jgi:hypothetical protein
VSIFGDFENVVPEVALREQLLAQAEERKARELAQADERRARDEENRRRFDLQHQAQTMQFQLMREDMERRRAADEANRADAQAAQALQNAMMMAMLKSMGAAVPQPPSL